MWSRMNAAPSRAPASWSFRQHSHSSRAEAAGALGPVGVTAIGALAAAGAELRILDLEHAYQRVVDVHVLQVVKLLQHEVAGIEQDAAAFVLADAFKEALEAGAVEQVHAGMHLVAEVDAVVLAEIGSP
ncbi:hypothetical protein G6F55_014066 [Rhizopus delemar]|nr:hypothetical protein G6F55_014066 [Rhizopus delemar]